MKPIYDEFINWVGGITTSPSADMLPENMSPRGRNTNLVNVGQGSTQIGSRKGLQTGNVTPITGSPSIIGQHFLKRAAGTKVHLLVSNTGRLDKYNTDLTTSTVNATALTSGNNYPSFATVNDVAIIANGVDLKKTDGTTVWRVGIARPLVADFTAAVAAGGGMSTGIWDVAITYVNSTTGEESSLSDFISVTTTGGNLKINVGWTSPAGIDPQVDYVRVYVRKQSLGPNVYLAVAGVTPAVNTTWNGYAISTIATVVDISDTVFGALKIIAPTTTSNNPPAVTLQFPVYHNNRLFLFGPGNAYYSNITDLESHPESFDSENVEAIGENDGDTITGAFSMPTGVPGSPNRLLIFKHRAIWEISGYDPTSWTVTRIDDRHGCGSHRTIKMAGGALWWWADSALGLMTMILGGTPLEVGKELLSATFSDEVLNNLALNLAVAEVDEANDLLIFSLPLLGSTTRNSIIHAFNYRVKRFVADGWNPMDIASFVVVEDLVSARVLYAGGYAGQIFKWWTGTNDGVPATTTGSGMLTGATSTTLVDSTASFSTTGGKLIERYVYHIPAIGDTQRRRITGNTGTTLTVTPAWDQALVVGDTYIVGGIDWQLDTPWMKSKTPFLKKNYSFFFLDATSQQTGLTIYVDVFTHDNLITPRKTLTLTDFSPGAIYDTDVYDNAVYAADARLHSRRKIGLTGPSYRLRIRQLQADRQILLQKVALQGFILGPKR